MKLLTLNLWGGVVYEPLMEFIKQHSKDVDIFCFQEMLFGDKTQFTTTKKARENLFQEIVAALPEFAAYQYISPAEQFEYEPISFPAGQAIFVRKTIRVLANGGFRCYDELPVNVAGGAKLTGSLQWLDVESAGLPVTIASLHGLWQKDTKKGDTPERFIQSQKIKDFLNTKPGQKIICGDFNLAIDGHSLEILEEGLTNLVKKYQISSTRSSYYKNEPRFADYILISPDISVTEFKVLPDEVSDHLPLLLDFK